MKEIKIGLIGFGTVGSAVYSGLMKNGSVLSANLGVKITLKGICDKNKEAFKKHGINKQLIKKNAAELISDPEIDIIIELIGGLQPARDYVIGALKNKKCVITANKQLIKKNAAELISDPEIDIIIELIGGLQPARDYVIRALKNKKCVITANKALLAEHKNEIFKIARSNGAAIFFEASVLAGVPIIKVIRESLVANSIKSIKGIINGTSNYILSSMYAQGISFESALKEAQAKGYAERNYSLDVDGHDSAHKLSILSSLAFGCDIKPRDIFVEGISNISGHDVMFAKELGYCIKLLAVAKRHKDCLKVRVGPMLLPNKHLLANVNEAYNAVYLKADLAKDIFLYGEGAGGSSTSSGILSDIAEAAKFIMSKRPLSAYEANIFAGLGKKIKMSRQIEASYYVRIMAVDAPGVLAKIAGILAKHKISIASVMQKSRDKVKAVPIIMLTHQAKEADLNKAIKEIDKQRVIMGRSVVINMERGV